MAVRGHPGGTPRPSSPSQEAGPDLPSVFRPSDLPCSVARPKRGETLPRLRGGGGLSLLLSSLLSAVLVPLGCVPGVRVSLGVAGSRAAPRCFGFVERA